MFKLKLALPVCLVAAFVSGAVSAGAQHPASSPVIEVTTLKIKDGVTVPQFSAVDAQVGHDYIAHRSGYLSRESAPGKDNTWVVIVHWRSLADADASMKSFETAPAASKFMSLLKPGSMIMTRYSR